MHLIVGPFWELWVKDFFKFSTVLFIVVSQCHKNSSKRNGSLKLYNYSSRVYVKAIHIHSSKNGY